MKTAADWALRGLSTLTVTLLLHGLPVAAQQQTPPEPAPAGEQDSDASSIEPGTPATEPAPAAASAENEDPFDYEASEQISEDLSVSFPVDI